MMAIVIYTDGNLQVNAAKESDNLKKCKKQQ